MFVPLNFLGTIYSSIIQSLVDVKNLSQLLTESVDITDAPGAPPLPLPNSFDTPRRDAAQCMRCKKPVSADSWLFCPYCGLDMVASSAVKGPMQHSAALVGSRRGSGVPVEFKSKNAKNSA